MTKKPKFILGVLSFAVMLFGFSIGLSGHAFADTECYFLAGGVNNGVCTGANSSTTQCGSYSVTGPTALTNLIGQKSNQQNLLNAFEKDITNFASDSGSPERYGGRWIANAMDGDDNYPNSNPTLLAVESHYSSSDFTGTLNNAYKEGVLTISIDCHYHFTNNTAYNAVNNEIQWIGGNDYTPSVVITYNGNQTVIKLDCGNPLTNPQQIKLNSWKLVNDPVTVDKGVVSPGQTVTYSDNITNNGLNNMESYVTWTTQWYSNDGANNTGTFTHSPLSSGGTFSSSNSFKIPSSATDGQSYCEGVIYGNPLSETNGNFDFSTHQTYQACTTVSVPTQPSPQPPGCTSEECSPGPPPHIIAKCTYADISDSGYAPYYMSSATVPTPTTSELSSAMKRDSIPSNYVYAGTERWMKDSTQVTYDYADYPVPTRTQLVLGNVSPSSSGGTVGHGLSSTYSYWSYSPTSPSITVQVNYTERPWVYVEFQDPSNTSYTAWGHFQDPNYEPYTVSTYSFNTLTIKSCYSATCTITSVTGNGPNGIIVDGGTFTVNGYITNTSLGDGGTVSLPQYLNSAQLSITDPANGGPHYQFSGGIGPPPDTSGFSYTATVPSSITGAGTVAVSPYPDYYGNSSIGSACSGSGSQPVYAPFILTPHAYKPSGSEEDPTANGGSIPYETGVTNSISSTVQASIASSFYKVGGPTYASNNVTDDYGNKDTLDGSCTSSNPSPGCSGYSIGDQYCSTITLNNNSWNAGYVGPGGPTDLKELYIDPSTPTSAQDCLIIHNEPYAQFFGNDVIGDSAFDASGGTTTCGAGGDSSGIYTLSRASSAGSGPSKGSYTQFGAQALADIEGLGSAGLRPSTISPTGALGLSFSNNTHINNSRISDGASLGGQFGTSVCAPTKDYFQDELPSSTLYSGGTSFSSGDYHAGISPASVTTIGGAIGSGSQITVQPGERTAVFVTGNAYITSNIVYSGATTSWGSIGNIPSFWIIATGNIYIDPSVTRLDGVYVAQPNANAKTGYIDTCANFNGGTPGAYTVNSLYGDSNGCDQQLTVNGAFIDQATELNRTFSSVRYSTPGENPQSAAHSCGNPGADVYSGGPTSTPTCAAEVFNFSPEIYLAQPALKNNGGKYEYITSLSPVL